KVADLPHQLALSRHVGDDGRGRAEQQLMQAAGLRVLHVGEGLLRRVPASRQGEVDELLVDLELVLHERDLQFLTAETAAERLQEVPRASKRLVGARGPARRVLDLALDVVELESEGGK